MFWRGRQERVGEEAKGEGRGEPQPRRASVRELGLQNQKVRGDLEERVPKGAEMVEERREALPVPLTLHTWEQLSIVLRTRTAVPIAAEISG